MKTTRIIVAVGSLLLAAPLVQAQDVDLAPVADKANFKTANDVSMAIVDEMLSIFNMLEEIKDDATADAFDKTIDKSIAQIKILAALLKTKDKPDDAQIEEMAKKAVQMRKEIGGAMQGMMALMMDTTKKDLAKKVKESMDKMQGGTQDIDKTLEEYYPKEKMDPLIKKYSEEEK